MQKYLLPLLLAILTSQILTAQTLFRGLVVNEETRQPIANAKIGISDQGVGVITKGNGRFNYRKYNKVLDSDSKLIVTALGYEDLILGIDDIRGMYNQNATIMLKVGNEKKRKKTNVVSVFWDISEGMIDRDEDKELAYLSEYLSKYDKVKVNFVLFNDKIKSWNKLDIKNGDISKFKNSLLEVSYEGPADYGLLQIEGIDEILLFSNGDPTFGTLNVNRNIPVFAVSTTNNIDENKLQKIADFTDGGFTTLQNFNLKDRDSSKDQAKLSQNNSKIKITGSVSSLNTPLQGATILKLGTFSEASTDSNGRFHIEAKTGDILAVNYLGMFENRIVIEDDTDYKIELIPESDVLDEVVLKGTIKDIIVGNKIMKGRPSDYFPGGTTGFGDFYITADDITPNARTLEQVIIKNFKAAQIRNTPKQGPILLIRGKAPAYVVNGILLGPGEPPPLYLSDAEIESIVVKYGSEETSRYTPGRLLGGVAIIVTTKNSSFVKKQDKYNPLVKGNEYQDDVNISTEALVSKSKSRIKGKVTSLGKPLQKASVNVRGSFDENFTDANGNFEINANEGDELIVSYLGMYPKGVAISDQTNYTIELIPQNDVLDEVTLNGEKREERNIKTPTGNKNFDAIGYDIKQLKEEDIGNKYPTLGDALNGKFASISAIEDRINGLTVLNSRYRKADGSPVEMLIVIDNQLYPPNVPRPFISTDRVNNIVVIKGLAGTTRYGSLAAGGVVEITTNAFDNSTKSNQKSVLVKDNDYKDDIKSIARRVTTRSSATQNSKVKGKVISSGKPIQGATVNIKGTFDELYTKDDGSFEIKASSGDILVVNALGMFKREILIEDQYNLTIELTSKSNDLDEIIVSGNKRVDNTIETAYGKENADKIGYAVDEIKSESFNTGATNLRQLITGRFPGVRVIGGTTGFSGSNVIYQIRGGNQSIENDIPPAWVVNGVVTDQEPSYIDVQQIESISVLKSTAATNKYGTIASGGAFVITTKNGVSSNSTSQNIPSALVTGNNYINDAISVANLNEQDYITRLREIPSIDHKFEAYRRMARTKELSLEFYSDMARFFQTLDLKKADIVRSDLAYVARKNAKALRTLAYLYEEAGDMKKTLLTYQKVLELVPDEAQSYRDVANAYVMNQDYNKALEVYINALGERVKGVDFSGIEPALKTELSRLVQLYKDKIEFSRLPNEWLRADFKQDVRMVIEWSDASVPFEFQFVNPDKKFFKWNHTLEENRERLQAEIKQGFQMEEFIIDDAPRGEWLINVQYLGEEDDYILPPFLKYTLFRDFGTPNETKEVRVIKLFRQTEKVTLAKLEI